MKPGHFFKPALAGAALMVASACGPTDGAGDAPATEVGVSAQGIGATRPNYAAPRSPVMLGVHSPDIARNLGALTAMFPGRKGWLVKETYSTDVNWIGGMLNDMAIAAGQGFTPVLRVDYARGSGNVNPQGDTVAGATIPWEGGTSRTGSWGRCYLSPDPSARAATDITTPLGTHKECYLDYLRRVLTAPNNHAVHTWIIGNEMNMKGEALGFPGGQIPYHVYGDVYRAARQLIQSIDGHRNDAVYVGGVSPNATDFTPDVYISGKDYLTGLLYNLHPVEVDGITIHAYAGQVNDLNAGLRTFRFGTTAAGLGYQNTLQWIDALGFSQVPVLLSEWAANVEGASTENHVASFVASALSDMNAWNGGPSNHDLLGAVWYTWDDGAWPQQSLSRYPAIRQTFANNSNTYNAGNPDTGWGACWRQSTSPSRTFAETGKTVRGLFLSTYDSRGGLGVFGFPIAEEDCGVDTRTGRILWQQWFQRHRLEYHPELPAGSQVALGAIGSQLARTKGINPDDWSPGQTQPATNCTLIGPFANGGKWVCGAFRDYFNAKGLGLLGYPISKELDFQTKDGRWIRAQWFERARLEYNGAVTPIPIQGGLLGCEASGIIGPGC
ncbi:hypothetical protein HPC49_36005 [Pyxidicoccus fallax]|uniref:Asl1-like glycosyl hydrolase catalytic domain-containing protein n=1 Tax=Pyxidicoccus fallax TaxID=394095 RepID=A0A848LVK8_9BACT|nr:hypothetical protein [Pyxidicoccus fallax]NMO22118.1 hypothetical protein [Pyxidicoccus fallax]NPC83616.1 hypothetical protein [Pyxidicoccus fallax]